MRVRTARAAGGSIAAAFVAATLSAAPAQAGGPTSAFLSIPGAGQTSSLYYSDPEYDELAGFVGVSEPTGTFGGEESAAGHASGPGVTVTWLIHDVEPWRVDRIYVGDKGEVWISTQSTMDGSIWEAPALWHRPEHPARLAALLGDLGLGKKSVTDTGVDGAADAPADTTPPASPPASTPETVRDVTADGGQDWIASAAWAAGGLAAGVLLTVAWSRSRRRVAAEANLDVASSPAPWTMPDGPIEHLSSR
jgi:hypothetical protein